MIIELKEKFKSLKPFISEKLSDFTVITGKNGSGKSHFLEVIGYQKRHGTTTGMPKRIITPNISKIQYEGIISYRITKLEKRNWDDKINPIINEYKKYSINTKKLFGILIKSGIDKNQDSFFDKVPNTIINNEDLKKLTINSLHELNPNIKTTLMQPEHLESFFIENSNYKYIYNLIKVWSEISIYQSKNIYELEEFDFYTTPIDERYLDENDLFKSQIEYLFYGYLYRRYYNDHGYFKKEKYGLNNQSLSDDEFTKQFPPPWEVINDILIKHSIPFRFVGINREEFSPEIKNISFNLIKLPSKEIIDVSELSSGERIIIGLILKLFTCEFYKDSLELPELLLLDEPDSFLHPEMTKMMIDILNNTFVNEFGIKVIITTHSPSTVALAPENSIFQIENEHRTSLSKVSKQKALEILTENLPTLSINYENHKQVFVESPTDVFYYQTIFNKLNEYENYPFNLYFISNSMGKGNCEQVKSIVSNIRESGNNTSYGIIDWDNSNTEDDFIKVHGSNSRYSIENFIYDPIYLCVLFMELKAHNIHKQLGKDESYNHYDIKNEGEDFLQKVIDWFFSQYYKTIKVLEKEKLKEVLYINGKKVKLPLWYLDYHGHNLESNLRKVFNSLDKFSGEGKLQKELTLIIAKCYPLIPIESKCVLEKITKPQLPTSPAQT